MMPKLTKAQRDKMILIGIVTVTVVAALWILLVGAQNKQLERSRAKIAAAQEKLDRATQLIRRGGQIQAELDSKSARLKEIEENMASGDLYSWVIMTLNKFKAPYKVSIPSYSPAQVGEVGVLPVFPYKAATFNISGTAFFHDFGQFLADLENTYPYMRVQNLDLRPAVGTGVEPEQMEFKMEIVALVRPGGAN